MDVKVTYVHRPMVQNETDLNAEFIRFTNLGDSTADLSGWALKKQTEQMYTFPEGSTVAPNETVTVHSGSGTNTPAELYQDRKNWMLDPTGELISLQNRLGDLIDQLDTESYMFPFSDR